MSTDVATAAETVRRIWTEVLGDAPGNGAGATFFESGGESITATRLVIRIEEELGAEIEVGDIFEEDPTLESLVRLVGARSGGSEVTP
ncbi:acyl carrier protein [Streptomyces pacificus]|uniref:Acyl carrier protein n=1 Tax=Streptomyces pacificus TaxID=2705029 RepID=A0A6A0B407_9ACTN|nr:acyl carrier protein [Streptomyces pacificus]GFH39258.1 acyl carrier protein [Streptomyces pacificus]